MPQCAGCNKFLLTKDRYCRDCKEKIASGLLIPIEEEIDSEEELQRKKLVAELRKKKEREEDELAQGDRQKWKVSGLVENMASQHWDGLKRLTQMQGIITKKEFDSCVMDDFKRRISFLKFATICNAKFFLISNDMMVSVDRLGIDKRIGLEVEEIIKPLVSETIPIQELNCYADFPRINASWTDWLVYSTLLRWSSRLDVGLSSKKAKITVPLVAPYGQLNPETVEVSPRQRKFFVVDDLDNLDLLLEEMIEWQDIE